MFGATRNALNPALSAGGSSGGAAVAWRPFAAGGRRRQHGLAAHSRGLQWRLWFPPLRGRRAGEGRLACAPSLSTVGPLAADVADLEALLETLSGKPAPAPPFAVERARIGWLGDLEGYLAIEPEVLALSEQALRRFSRLGCAIEPARVDFSFAGLWQAYRDLRAWLNAATLGDLLGDPVKRLCLKADAIDEIERGLALTGMDVFAALERRARWRETLRALFAHYDALVLPAAPCLPFAVEADWPREIAGRAMDSYCRWMELAVFATMGGVPVAALPAGVAADGRAGGLQVMTAPGRDGAGLALARAYERAATGNQ